MIFNECVLKDLTVDGRGYYGIGASAVPYDINEFTYLRITDINDDGTLNYSGLMSVDDKDAGKYLLQPNDIVFARTGASTGRNYLYDGEIANMVYAGFLIKYSLDSEKVNPKYVKYYCLSKTYKDWVKSVMTGSTRGNVNEKQFGNMPIMVPERHIQDKIVILLDSLTNKIKLNNQINNNLLEQCRCLYKEWFIDFNFISKGVKYKDNNGKMIESEKGLIPVGWIYKRIDELDLDISDGNYSSKYPTKQEFQTEGIPFIRGTDFNGYSISRKNLMYITPEKHEILKKGHLKKNDILITTRGEIGRIVFVSDYFIDSNINAQLIRINGDKRYPRSFLGMSLLSDYVQNDIKSLVTGTALQQLPVGKFNQVKIIVPDDEEIIKSFDSIVEVALKKIQENEEQNEILEQLRDTLLPKLINGEINLDNI